GLVAAAGASVTAWTTALDLNIDGTFSDALTVNSVPVDLTSDLTRVTGDLSSLNIAGLVSGSAHFELTKQSIHVDQGGSVAASLLTFGLSALSLSIGTDTFGVSITGGSVAIAAVTPTSAVDPRRWLAVKGSELGADLHLGTLVTATLQHVSVQVNNFSGAGASALDWTTALDLNNDGTFADALTVNLVPVDLASDLTRVTGDLSSLNIAGLVSGSAHFELTKQSISASSG